MGKKRAGEHETEEEQQKAAAAARGTPPPDAKKKKKGGTTTNDVLPSAGSRSSCLCDCGDDVVGNILARVPARTAVASMALSKRHARLIRSPEFRSLHRRLAPPLPRPHVAFLVTAAVRRRRRYDEDDGDELGEVVGKVPAVSVFQGFHVAGDVINAPTTTPMPMRALVGRRYLGMEYVNSCNGVVLLVAGGNKSYSARCRCVLWNPAVADAVEEVSVSSIPPVPADAGVAASTGVVKKKDYRVLGLGYGQRSKTYKLLLLCRSRRRKDEAAAARGDIDGEHRGWHKDGTAEYSLVTYALPDLGTTNQPAGETELIPAVRDGEIICQQSLYIDGRVYLLRHSDTNRAAVLAFDVDDETVSSIDLPVERDPHGHPWYSLYSDAIEYQHASRLMELSGRPCVVADYGGGCALWLLSVDHKWHRRCLIGELISSERRIYPDSVMGVWDCGGVLVLYCMDGLDKLFLYDIATGKMFRANLGSVVTPKYSESSDSGYAMCWGYRPTLEAPSSIVGRLKQDKDGCREECSTHIMKALKPVAEQDRKKGQKATLHTVCFMDFLVRIMEKLPKDMQQVLEMKMMDSDDPDLTFENVLFRENI